jgi:hypothetical protein
LISNRKREFGIGLQKHLECREISTQEAELCDLELSDDENMLEDAMAKICGK